MAKTNPDRIVLKSDMDYDELVAYAALSPGHLLVRDSSNKVKKHATYGARAERLFAIEDSLQGKIITDAYAADDVVRIVKAEPGDHLYLRVPAGAVAIVIGDPLVSNGDGTLVKGVGGTRPLYASAAASAAISNTTTETAFDKSYTIPANFLKVGDKIKVRVQAIATATNSTDTLTLKLKIGSTVVVATAAVDVADNDVGFIDAEFVIRTIGASGTFVASGVQGLGVPGTVTAKPFLLASTAIDTTATQAITATATWSVASASNSVRADVVTVEIERVEAAIAFAEEAVDNSAGSSEAFIRSRVA